MTEEEIRRKEWEDSYREDWMTDDQFECYQLLADIAGGFNHLHGRVKNSGCGIRINTESLINNMATFDFDGLTRAVVMAHDRMIRLQISASCQGMLAFTAHKRKSRSGRMHHRHPTIEQAIQNIRGRYKAGRYRNWV